MALFLPNSNYIVLSGRPPRYILPYLRDGYNFMTIVVV